MVAYNKKKTELGKMLCIIRIEHDLTAADMANQLNISSATLSIIENGRKVLTPQLAKEIEKQYELNEKQIQILKKALNATLNVSVTELSVDNQLRIKKLTQCISTFDNQKLAVLDSMLKS